MARWRWVRFIGLSAVLATTACGRGGQTGQPTALACESGDSTEVPPRERVRGVSASELAHTFEGEYQAILRWEDPSRPAATLPSALLDEELTLTLTYAGASGKTSGGELGVTILLQAVTHDTGAREEGVAELWAPAGSSAAAHLDYVGAELGVFAALEHSGAGNEMTGIVQVISGEYPSASATFSSVALASGAGGKNGTAGAASSQSGTANVGGAGGTQ